jgi:SET domain-containing protein
MMLVPIYVAPSSIHGVGVFAAEPIAKGTTVWIPLYDRKFTDAEVAEMPPLMREFIDVYGYKDDRYPGIVFCGVDNGRFMNHSDTPNTDQLEEGNVAVRAIAAGEELTCDYALMGEEPPGPRPKS